MAAPAVPDELPAGCPVPVAGAAGVRAGAVGRDGTVAGVPAAGAAAAGASNMGPYVSSNAFNARGVSFLILMSAADSALPNHARKSMLLFRLPGTASVLPMTVMLVGFAGAGVAPPAAGCGAVPAGFGVVAGVCAGVADWLEYRSWSPI